MYIDKKFIKKCKNTRIIKNSKINQSIKDADYIIFAANWRLWDSGLIMETLNNLDIINKNVFIIGKKNFGDINFNSLLDLNDDVLTNYKSIISKDLLEVNKFMEQNIPNEFFINIHKIMCPDIYECTIIQNFNLLSHDGSHLTKSGAKYFGKIIFQNTKLNEILN